MAISLTQLAYAEGIAEDLGVNNWQLSQGSYNGTVFYTLNTVLNGLNQKYNPLAGVTTAATGAIGNVGALGLIPTDNTSLPYGTYTTSTGMQDEARQKLSIYRFFNNANGYESGGWNGNVFSVECFIWGTAYSQVLSNTLNNFKNDAYVYQTNKNALHVLVHPIYGTISNVLLRSYVIEHNPNKWRCCKIIFIFESLSPIYQIYQNTTNIGNILDGVISSILTLITDLNQVWGDYSLLTQFFSSSNGTSGNTNQLNQNLKLAATSVLEVTNICTYLTQKLVNNLAPVGYINTVLNNLTTTVPNTISGIYFFNSNLSPNNVNALMELINIIIDACKAIININNNILIYNNIANLTSLNANMGFLCNQLLNAFYGSTREYIVPIDTSLFNICIKEGLNYTNQIEKIILLNQEALQSVCYIPKGTTLLLPIATSPSGVL